MSNPDQIARAVGLAALAVSSGSLGISILTYRRGTPKVRVGIHQDFNIGPGETREYNILIRLTNPRASAIQVRSIGFQAYRKPAGATASLGEGHRNGPDIPHKVEGFHVADWRFAAADLAEALSAATGRPTARLRAVVELGNGSTIRSRWKSLDTSKAYEGLQQVARELRRAP